jgi:hypothetical protein
MESTAELLERLVEGIRKNGDTFGSAVLYEGAASGADIPQSHLTKIKKWTRQDQPTESIHTFPVLMIDTAPTRNNVIYTAQSQKKSIKAWQGTTFLFNSTGQNSGGLFGGSADHTLQAASQMGRIYDSRLVRTPKGETGSLSYFYSVEGIDSVTDGFIRKLEAGILREVSIHVSVPEGVICSICNDAFSKCMDNAGEYHYPGETYKKPKGSGKETCYMSTGEGILVPLELSAVACPGSVNAHVMQDDEVEDYPVVSLREALGGSREVIEAIHQENTMKTPEQIAEARKKLVEAAAAAGVKIAEFVENAANKDAIEAADVTQENLAETLATELAHEDEEAKKKAKKDDDGDEDPPADGSKQNHLFSNEDCPVCGRSEATNPTPLEDSAAVAKVREEFRAQVTSVVEKSNAAIAAAKADADAAEARAQERDVIFTDFVEETVTLAIERGHKKSSERDSYRESLMALPYLGVREVREAFKTVTKDPDKAKAGLVETMEARAKTNLGATKIETTEAGTKRTTTTTGRARFAAK